MKWNLHKNVTFLGGSFLYVAAIAFLAVFYYLNGSTPAGYLLWSTLWYMGVALILGLFIANYKDMEEFIVGFLTGWAFMGAVIAFYISLNTQTIEIMEVGYLVFSTVCLLIVLGIRFARAFRLETKKTSENGNGQPITS